MRYLRLIVLIVLMPIAPGRVLAEDEPSPVPGSRVRLLFPCRILHPDDPGDCRLTGRLVRWESDSLAVRESDRTVPFALRDLNRLELSRGQKSFRFLGAGVGALFGAGTTYLILNSGGSTALCDRSANQDAMSSSECLGLYALGGLAGAGLGYVIGNLIHHDHWADVPIPR